MSQDMFGSGYTSTLTSDQLARLDGVVALLRRRAGWHISPERDDTFTSRPESRPRWWGDHSLWPGVRVITLPTLHITSVKSVTLEDGTVLDPTSYEWHDHGTIHLDGAYSGAITVAYRHGYADVPDLWWGVTRPALDSSASGGVASLTVDGTSVTYFAAGAPTLGPFNDSLLAAIDEYALPRLP